MQTYHFFLALGESTYLPLRNVGKVQKLLLPLRDRYPIMSAERAHQAVAKRNR